jgi:hypothetical protein
MSFHFLLKTLFLSSAAAVLLAGCGDSAAADAPFPVDLDGVYGYVNQQGEWAIPPRFEAANFFQDDGAAWVRFAGRYGRIDQKDGWALQPTLTYVTTLAENGLAQAQDDNDKWGFINARGEWVIPPKFKGVASFAANGLATAKDNNGKWGFINAKGEWVIPPKFKGVGSFSSGGVAWVRLKEDDSEHYIDSTGRSVVPVAHDSPASASMKVRAVADHCRPKPEDMPKGGTGTEQSLRVCRGLAATFILVESPAQALRPGQFNSGG